MAERPFPPAERYEGFPMHEDGIGMARTFELEFDGASAGTTGRGAASSPRSTPDAAAQPRRLHRVAVGTTPAPVAVAMRATAHGAGRRS